MLPHCYQHFAGSYFYSLYLMHTLVFTHTGIAKDACIAFRIQQEFAETFPSATVIV